MILKTRFLTRIIVFARSLLMTILYFPFLLGISILTLSLSLIVGRRDLDDRMVALWGRWSCWMFGVEVQGRGLDNLKIEEGAVLIFNHASFFDIFAIASHVPGVRFGAKIELFRIPFFGAAMRQLGMLPIDRTRRESVFRIYDETQSRIKNGEIFALAPEGGRSKSRGLAPFKAGPFVLAIKAQAPLIPLVIHGASEILPKGSLVPNPDQWNRHLVLQVLPAISTEGIDLDSRPRLQQKVYELMRAQIKE